MNKEKHTDSSAINETMKGTFTAIFERAAFGEPLQRMKYDYQVKKQINLSFFWLYSSFFPNTANMIITTGSQFYFNYIAKQITDKYLSCDDDFKKSVIESCSAGAFSAILTSPIEAVMINQSKNNMKFMQSAKFLSKNGYSKFYRGLFSTVFREAIFTSSYISLTPYFKRCLEKDFNLDEKSSWLISVFGIGFIASYASQPFDTINTIQKGADINDKISFIKAVKTNSTNNLFKGAMLRSVGVMWAIGMYNIGPKIYDEISEAPKKLSF